jgi:tetratricopeptide (TPR) repeat protein
VETVINKVAQVGPGWLMGLLLVVIALAVLLATVRARRGRQKEGHGSEVIPLTTSQQVPYGEAEETYRAQIKKAKEDFGPEDPHVVGPMRHLAMLYRNLGKYTAAEPLLHRSLAILEKTDPGNIEISAILEQLAEVCQAQGRYEAAELILLRSLTIRERALGPDHPHVTPLLEQIAMLYRKLERTGEARIFEQRAKLVRSRN